MICLCTIALYCNAKFTPDKNIKNVIAKIAVDSKYWLYINDEAVIREGGVKRGEKPDSIYYDEIDRSLDRAIEARQKAIEDYSKDLAKMKEYTGIISLTAPYDGVVTDLAEHEVGDALAYHEGVVQVADKSLCYIVAENKDGKLSYGNEATITYTAEDGAKKEVQGMLGITLCIKEKKFMLILPLWQKALLELEAYKTIKIEDAL